MCAMVNENEKKHLEHSYAFSVSCVFKLFTHCRFEYCLGKLHMFNFESNNLKAAQLPKGEGKKNTKKEA